MILHERTKHLKDTIPALKMSLRDLGKLSDLTFISSFVKAVSGMHMGRILMIIKYSVPCTMYNI